MADIDTSIYKNQPDPLGSAAKVFGLITANQQLQNLQQTNQLLQTANQQSQYNLKKGYSDAIINVLGPLAARGDVNKATALGNVAAVIRATGIPPDIANPMLETLRNTPDDPKSIQSVLGNLFAIQAGTGAGQPVSGAPQPGTMAPTTEPLGKRVTGGNQPVAPGPEESAAAAAAGGTGGKSLGEARVISSNLQNSTYGLRQAIKAVEHLSPQDVGPFTKEITGIKSFLISSGAAKTLGIEPELISKVTDWQTANKYLNDWARQSGDTHSVAHLDAAQESNPNMSLQQNTILKVARTGLGLARMKYMQQQEFDSATDKNGNKLPASQFPQWVAKNWNVKHDPAVFIFDQMSLDQRKKYLSTMSKNKQDVFLADVGRAEKAGAIDLEQ